MIQLRVKCEVITTVRLPRMFRDSVTKVSKQTLFLTREEALVEQAKGKVVSVPEQRVTISYELAGRTFKKIGEYYSAVKFVGVDEYIPSTWP